MFWCGLIGFWTSLGCRVRLPIFMPMGSVDRGLILSRRFGLCRRVFLQGIVHDRRLMRDASVNLAIRWFAGYGMSEALPDHSSLTRSVMRWRSRWVDALAP